MDKIYLIHGWGGSNSSEGWFGWLKREAKKKNFLVVCYNMPNTDAPKIEEWVGYMQNKINEEDLNEKTYFIGHSIGCQSVLRYLETLNPKTKVGGAVLIAPWMKLDMNTINEEGEEVIEIARPWMETPINFNKIKKHTKNFLAVFSDNDPYVEINQVEEFKKNLNAKTIVKHNEEHFNETQEIPEIFDLIK